GSWSGNKGPATRTEKHILERDGPKGGLQLRQFKRTNAGFERDGTEAPEQVAARPFESGLVELGRRRDTIAIKGRTPDSAAVDYASPPNAPGAPRSVSAWMADGLDLPPRRMWAGGVWVDVPGAVVRVHATQRTPAGVCISTLDVLDLDATQTVAG